MERPIRTYRGTRRNAAGGTHGAVERPSRAHKRPAIVARVRIADLDRFRPRRRANAPPPDAPTAENLERGSMDTTMGADL